jgi:hypothetical protein
MNTRLRRSFRPVLDGFRLEDRVVLNAFSPSVKPLATTSSKPVLTQGFFQQTPILLHTAFQAFLTNQTGAQQIAIRKLANGANPASLIAALQTNTTVQGGILQSKVLQIANRLPNGVTMLYTPTLQPEIQSMITMLNNNQSQLPPTSIPNSNPALIVQTYQTAKMQLVAFGTNELNSGAFILAPNQGPPPSVPAVPKPPKLPA